MVPDLKINVLQAAVEEQLFQQSGQYMFAASNNLPDLQHRSLETRQIQAQENNIYTKTWFKVLGIYLIVQAIIGIIAIEYAWYRTKRFREKNEKRDGRFEAFRRLDADKWARWKFYPGAMLIMPTRIILLLIDGVFCTMVIMILSIGHDFRRGPMKNGCRKWCIFFLLHVCCTFYLFVCGMRTTLSYKDIDYSEYLGPGYKRTMKKIKRTSTIVSNHVSWLEPVILIKNIRPAFAPSEEFRNVPLLGTICKIIDSIFIPRGGSEESKARSLMLIRERQEIIEETGQYAPFLMFPEAGTSNGSHILSMKKGAFFAEKTVRPIFLKYNFGTISPAFEVMEFLPLAILQMSCGIFKCHLTVLPDFQPNEYFFQKYQSKGAERWEIYAWAIRDIMCNEGDFKKCNIPLRKKIEYEKFMTMQPGATHPDDIVIDHEGLLEHKNFNSSDDQLMRPSLLPLSEKHSQFSNPKDKKGLALSDEELFPDEEKGKYSQRSEMQIISQEVAEIKDIYVNQVAHKADNEKQ